MVNPYVSATIEPPTTLMTLNHCRDIGLLSGIFGRKVPLKFSMSKHERKPRRLLVVKSSPKDLLSIIKRVSSHRCLPSLIVPYVVASYPCSFFSLVTASGCMLPRPECKSDELCTSLQKVPLKASPTKSSHRTAWWHFRVCTGTVSVVSTSRMFGESGAFNTILCVWCSFANPLCANAGRPALICSSIRSNPIASES